MAWLRRCGSEAPQGPRWGLVCVVLFLVGLAALIRFLDNRPDKVLERLDSMASVTGLVVALASFLLSALVAIWQRRTAGIDRDEAAELDRAADRLARAVHQQWSEEIATRRLRHPWPLRLRWSLTGRQQVAARTDVVAGSSNAAYFNLFGTLSQQPEAAPTRELVTAFRALPARQMVVLGRPGAGKSVLAMLFTLDVISPGEPVPVLLPAAAWNPAVSLRSWVIARIREDYPASARSAERLVSDNRVLAVLDGLDEMPDRLLADAMTALDHVSGDGFPFVVTCRAEQFEAAARQAGPLSRAAVVEVESVDLEDAIDYLTGSEAESSTRWDPVVDHVREETDGPLARVLSTPLMLSLARIVYRAPSSDPQVLVHLTESGAVEDHLLERFLPNAYENPGAGTDHVPRYRPEKARRWLTTLAGHLAAGEAHTSDAVNLNWWRFDRMVSRAVITILVAAVITTSAVLVAIVGARSLNGAIPGLLIGVPLALVAGISTGRSTDTEPPGGKRAARVIAAALRDSLIAGAALVMLLAMFERPRVNLNWAFADYVSRPLFACLLFSACLSTIANGLAMSRPSVPSRAAGRLGTLGMSLLGGVGLVLPLAIPAGAAVAVVVGIAVDDPVDGLLWGLLLAMVVVAVVGVPVSLGRWLGTPVDEQRVRSPMSALETDRRTLSYMMLTVGAVPLVFALGAAVVTDVSTVDLLANALVAGAALAIIVCFGSGALSLRYTLALVWLAVQGKLPLRLMRFLDDAHRRGVLRQAGASFQFRHDRLQRHLSLRGVRPSRRPARGGTRIRRAAHTVAAGIALIVVAAVVTVPGLRNIIDRRAALQASRDLLAQADRLEHTDPDAALRLRIAAASLANTSAGHVIPLDLFAKRHESNDVYVPLGTFAQLHEGMATSWKSQVDGCWCSLSGEHGVLTGLDSDSGSMLIVGASARRPLTFMGSPNTRSYAVDDQARRAVTVGSDGTILWDLTSAPPKATTIGDGAPTEATLTFSHSGRWAIRRLWDSGQITLWDLDALPPKRTDLVDARPAGAHQQTNRTGARFTEDGQHVIAVADGRATVLNLTTGASHRVSEQRVTDENNVEVIGDSAVVLSAAGEVSLLNLSTGIPIRLEVSAYSIRLANARLLIASTKGTSSVWDMGGDTPTRLSLGQLSNYRSEWPGQLSPDGRWLVLGREDEPRAALMDLSAVPPKAVMEFGSHFPLSGFSSDGHYLTSITDPENQSLWPLSDGTPREIIIPWDPPEEFSSELTRYSPDGRTVAIHTNSGIRVWAVDSTPPRLIANFDASDVAFSSDGSEIYSIDLNLGAAWSIEALRKNSRPPLYGDDARSYACRLAGRGLNQQEWNAHVPSMPYRPTC